VNTYKSVSYDGSEKCSKAAESKSILFGNKGSSQQDATLMFKELGKLRPLFYKKVA
jgi:hypothetical protein